MAANDRIIVAPQNRQEQSGIDALKPYLRPWRCTFVDQRDDFGRDGFVQCVDVDRDGVHSISPITFPIQCKSDKRKFLDEHGDSVETRHLALWADDFAAPLILVLWSVAENRFRFRSAKDVAAELDQTTPGWRKQDYVTVRYRSNHGFESSAEALNWISRIVKDQLDRRGGVETYHSTLRRTVLTSLFPQGCRVSTTDILSLTNGTDRGDTDAFIIFGEGWSQDDVDTYEIMADRTLVASLMLYEEVWLSFHSLHTCLHVLGHSVALDLIERGRIKPFAFGADVAFYSEKGSVSGRLVRIQRHADDPVSQALGNILLPDQKKHFKSLRASVICPSTVDVDQVVSETEADLRKANVRNLLGLRPHVADTEPVWDAQLVNRLYTINRASTVAKAVRADAVQLEGGLSRLFTEKYYSAYGLERQFESSKAFDAVLRSTGAPDLGQLIQRIPLPELCALSDTPKAQQFRDWFWSSAAGLLGTGASITKEFLQNVELLVEKDLSPYRFAVELKYRYLNPFGSPYLLGGDRSPAFSTTSSDGDRVAEKQRKNWVIKRAKFIQQAGLVRSPYDICPCGSGVKYRFCCGRPASKL